MKSIYKMALAALSGAALGAAAIHGLHAQGKPLAYAITEVEIIDQAAFNEFSPKVPATMQPFGGKYLVRGGKVVALDGDAPKRVVVSVFDSIEKAQAWRDSAEWKALTPIRTKAAKTRAYIAEGVTADRAVALLESGKVEAALQTMASCLTRLAKIDPEESLRAAYCHRVVRR